MNLLEPEPMEVLSKQLIGLSKKLTKGLRHKPSDVFNTTLDREGYVLVDIILKSLSIDYETLSLIVKGNDKSRFEFNRDGTKLRACQGHTIPVQLKLEEVVPPRILYHGTVETNKQSILSLGLLKGRRNHVHLSGDIDTAINVGSRKAKMDNPVVVFEIDAARMRADGLKIYVSTNGVYLTTHVPFKYIKSL